MFKTLNCFMVLQQLLLGRKLWKQLKTPESNTYISSMNILAEASSGRVNENVTFSLVKFEENFNIASILKEKYESPLVSWVNTAGSEFSIRMM